MWFMRFAIDAVFLDREGNVLRVVERLRPWRMAGCLGAKGDVVREAHPKVQFPNCDIALAHGTGGSLGTRHVGATVIMEPTDIPGTGYRCVARGTHSSIRRKSCPSTSTSAKTSVCCSLPDQIPGVRQSR